MRRVEYNIGMGTAIFSKKNLQKFSGQYIILYSCLLFADGST